MSPMEGVHARAHSWCCLSHSPNSDMTARLQQSSILDWAQSQHQSAASGTGVWLLPLVHIILLAAGALR